MAANDPIDLDLQMFSDDPLPRPSTGTCVRHFLLLALTFCTVTIAGTLFPFGENAAVPDADPQTAGEFVNVLLALPGNYVAFILAAVANIFHDPAALRYGLSFSLSLLFILISHEMGHYIACRIYRVQATLPFFIPTPPMIGPAGTFGAFIKIQSPMPSRKAVFDIGVAGPIAGFIALIPVALIGLITMEMATPDQLANTSGLSFSDPLFMKLVGAALGKNPAFGIGNAFYF